MTERYERVNAGVLRDNQTGEIFLDGKRGRIQPSNPAIKTRVNNTKQAATQTLTLVHKPS